MVCTWTSPAARAQDLVWGGDGDREGWWWWRVLYIGVMVGYAHAAPPSMLAHGRTRCVTGKDGIRDAGCDCAIPVLRKD